MTAVAFRRNASLGRKHVPEKSIASCRDATHTTREDAFPRNANIDLCVVFSTERCIPMECRKIFFGDVFLPSDAFLTECD